MIGGRDGKHASVRNTSLFLNFACLLDSRNYKQASFPHKCRAQSVIFFISSGVYIYMYVLLFFLAGKKCPTDI